MPEDQNLLKLKELEVNSLFEISKAINENVPFDDLFKHYEYALKSQLKVGKLALFVVDKGNWVCKVNYGTKKKFKTESLNEKVLEIKEECQILKDVISPDYNDFQLVSPIKHSDKIIAYLLLGGMYDRSKIPIEIDIPFIRTFTNLMVVAIENRRMAQEELRQEAMKRELEIAKRVQSLLFPEILPSDSKLRISAENIPHSSIGGDFYDYQETKNGFFLCVADVSGKGVPAALLMSNFQAAFRIIVRQTEDLSEIIQELNKLIYENSKGELFITLFLLKYNTKTQNLEYINAGHNPGILLNENKVIELTEGTTVLGVFDPLPFMNFGTIHLKAFKLVLFSDGVSESENTKNQHFGEDGIIKTLNNNRDKSAHDISKAIFKSLDKFRNGKALNDDLTLIVCEKR